MKKIKAILKLMRIKHYLKNGLIVLPLFFSSLLTDSDAILNIVVGFLIFSFASSIVYIINDIKDVEKDRNHPIKKERPLASKKISISFAIFLLIILMLLIFFIQFLYFGMNYSIYFVLTYIILNILYSIKLKNIALIDVSIVAFGFLLRVYYGASIIDVEVSNWLYLTILFAAFYMALGKRRNELEKQNSKNTREVLRHYTREFLDKNMYMCLGSTIVFYSLWAMDVSVNTSNIVIWTIPLVTLILMRYSLIVEKDSHGDPVDVLLGDYALMILAIIYAIMLAIAFYFIGG
jgi:4-hydroxybenzoate polyprenyltransferase and related prenyltransferases